MKKSLILSVVMTLVLVISMSTATYAWYTANSSVNATSTTITAASAGSDLAISLTSGEGYADSVALPAMSNANGVPMAPTADVVKAGSGFQSATFNAAADEGSQYTWSAATPYVATLYLYNKSTNTEDVASVNVTPSITASASAEDDVNGDASSLVKICVFAGDTLVYTNGYNKTSADQENTKTAAAAVNQSFSVAGSAEVVVTVVIWLEGIDMSSADQLKMADISLTFA